MLAPCYEKFLLGALIEHGSQIEGNDPTEPEDEVIHMSIYPGPRRDSLIYMHPPTTTTSLDTAIPQNHILTSRDDALDPALDHDVAWASVVAGPPPPYTPGTELHASTDAPLPAGTGLVNEVNKEHPSSTKIILVVGIVLLGIILGVLALIMVCGRSKRKNYFRFKVPKFPAMRKRKTNAKEDLSWKMENGGSGGIEMSSIREFDNATWGTPRTEKDIDINTGDPEGLGLPIMATHDTHSPVLNSSDQLPWPVPTHRLSYPLVFDLFAHGSNSKVNGKKSRAKSMLLSMDMLMSQRGPPPGLNSISEDLPDFVGNKDRLGAGILPSHDQKQPTSCTYSLDTTPETLNAPPPNSVMHNVIEIDVPVSVRPRQDSNASRTTKTSTGTSIDGFSVDMSISSSISSMASVTSGSDGSGSEDLKSDVDEVFELRRVTNSMEVGKGVLMALPNGRLSDSGFEMPKLIVSCPTILETGDENAEFAEISIGPSNKTIFQNTMPLEPSFSIGSVSSSASTVSVNLDDFPVPPVHLPRTTVSSAGVDLKNA